MLLEVGTVVKPHGVQGEVSVWAVTNYPERRFAPGSVLQTDRGPMEVVAGRPHHHAWLVSFAGVTDRNAAEALRGLVLSAEAMDDQGALWVHELVGSEVVDTTGTVLGRVASVEANPASDLLVLEREGKGETLVPLVFVVSRDPGRLVIDPPEGLLDL